MVFVRGLVNAAFVVGAVPGFLLASFAIVGVGIRGRRPAGRMWGRLGRLSRPAFAAYFGTLGVSWYVCSVLLLAERDESYFVWLITAPAVICLVLAVGWAIAVVSARRVGR
jgi:hypothetical protein